MPDQRSGSDLARLRWAARWVQRRARMLIPIPTGTTTPRRPTMHRLQPITCRREAAGIRITAAITPADGTELETPIARYRRRQTGSIRMLRIGLAAIRFARGFWL